MRVGPHMLIRGAQAPSTPTVPISGYTAIGTAQNSWFWDTKKYVLTGSAPNQYVVRDQYSRLKALLPNGCNYIDVESVSPVDLPGSNTVDVALGGAAQSHALHYTTPNVKQTIRLTVPGTGTRTVELYEQGCYITGLTPQTTATIVPASTPTSSCVFVGASGTMGYYAYDPLDFDPGVYVFLLSATGRLKTSGKFGTSYVLASNGFGLENYVASPSPSTCAAWATAEILPRCPGTSRKVAVLEFGAGDYFHEHWDAATLTTNYGYVVDAIHTLDPTIEIYLKTLIVMGGSYPEGRTNAAGVTQQGVRNAIINVATGRAWLTILHGYLGGSTPAETTSTGDLQDGLHATYAAHRDKIYPYLNSVL